MFLLAQLPLGAVSCPDSRGISLPTSTLSDSCDGNSGIFTEANLAGEADVLTIYNGDQL